MKIDKTIFFSICTLWLATISMASTTQTRDNLSDKIARSDFIFIGKTTSIVDVTPYTEVLENGAFHILLPENYTYELNIEIINVIFSTKAYQSKHVKLEQHKSYGHCGDWRYNDSYDEGVYFIGFYNFDSLGNLKIGRSIQKLKPRQLLLYSKLIEKYNNTVRYADNSSNRVDWLIDCIKFPETRSDACYEIFGSDFYQFELKQSKKVDFNKQQIQKLRALVLNLSETKNLDLSILKLIREPNDSELVRFIAKSIDTDIINFRDRELLLTYFDLEPRLFNKEFFYTKKLGEIKKTYYKLMDAYYKTEQLPNDLKRLYEDLGKLGNEFKMELLNEAKRIEQEKKDKTTNIFQFLGYSIGGFLTILILYLFITQRQYFFPKTN